MPLIFPAALQWHQGNAARADKQRTGIRASYSVAAANGCAAGNGDAMPFEEAFWPILGSLCDATPLIIPGTQCGRSRCNTVGQSAPTNRVSSMGGAANATIALTNASTRAEKECGTSSSCGCLLGIELNHACWRCTGLLCSCCSLQMHPFLCIEGAGDRRASESAKHFILLCRVATLTAVSTQTSEHRLCAKQMLASWCASTACYSRLSHCTEGVGISGTC